MSKSKKIDKCGDFQVKNIQPLTINQKKLFDSFIDGKDLIAAIGLAGTGKTFSSLFLAFSELANKNSFCNRIIIIRNNIPVREIGHLPGDENEKSEVYEKPYISLVNELFGRGDAYGVFKQRGVIEFGINSFLQGTTFSDCIVIVDEVQNYNFRELDMLISRAGPNTKFILCGDTEQSYIGKGDKSGLGQLLNIISKMDSADIVTFSVNDIVRSGLVKEYLLAKININQPEAHNTIKQLVS